MFGEMFTSDENVSFHPKNLFFPLTNTKIFLFFTVCGFITYGNMLFNGFVWDDKTFIINNPQVHTLNIFSLLGHNMFNSGPFYRPIPAMYFAIIYSLFGQLAFFYHAIQLLLHIVVTFLICLLFKKFFTRRIAFFLSFLFLLHPVNVESVAFIGATQSELYAIPGLIALLIAQKKQVSFMRLISITVLLLISLLTKETGLLFLLVVLLYRYLFGRNELKKLLFSGVILVAVYVLLRYIVGGVSYNMSDTIPIASLPFVQRLLHIPIIIFSYLNVFFFPLQLAIWQIWTIKEVTFQNFFIPVAICICCIAVWCFVFAKIKQSSLHNVHATSTQQFIFFSVWFCIGMGMLLQIVPLDMTVADRWFYFPMVGLLGMIGVIMQQFPVAGKYKHVVLIGMIAVLCILSLRTMIRNRDWYDEKTLYTHDSAIIDNFEIENSLGVDLAGEGYYYEAVHRLERSVALQQIEVNLTNLAVMEAMIHTNDAARKHFASAYASVSRRYHPHRHGVLLYDNYAMFLVLNDDMQLAEQVIKMGLQEYPESANLWTAEAILRYKKGEWEQATYAANKIVAISSSEQNVTMISHINRKQPFTYFAFNKMYTIGGDR